MFRVNDTVVHVSRRELGIGTVVMIDRWSTIPIVVRWDSGSASSHKAEELQKFTPDKTKQIDTGGL